jgi:hydroxyacylglutathione hydrolase
VILTRFYDQQLAQASYLVGCSEAAEALIVDPNRRVEQYVEEADEAGLRITAVTETHIHADFVSGARELAARTGARLLLSDAGGQDWRYRYAASAGAVPLVEGSTFSVGRVRFDVRHTPGHTPEHLAFLVTDTAAAEGPVGVATGDFVFAGDVGRPDLLERAVGVANAADGAARILYHSLQRFRQLPDHLQIWPGHGAGSACGKGLSAMPQSTVGYERRYNWAFGITEEDAFVEAVLAGQPEPPRYFKEMKRINRDGPPILEGPVVPRWLPGVHLRPLLAAGAMVVDLRPAAEFAAGHIPGTISIPFNRAFTNWAGWLLPYDREFYLIAGTGGETLAATAARDLVMIGLERVDGWLGAEAFEEWTRDVGPLETSPAVTLAQLRGGNDRIILDVRNRTEWDAGHLPGAKHLPLGYLLDRLDDIPLDRPLVVHCQGGARSAIALSLLQARGRTNAADFTAGFSGWSAAGLPVVHE